MLRKIVLLTLLVISCSNASLNAQRLYAGTINQNILPGYQFSDWAAFSSNNSMLFVKSKTSSGSFDMLALLLSGASQQFNRKVEAGYEKGTAKEPTVAEKMVQVCDTLYYIRRGRDQKKDQETFYVQDMLKQLVPGKAPMQLLDTVPYALNRYEDITYCTSPDNRKTAIVSFRVNDKKDTVTGLHLLILDSLFRPLKRADVMVPVSPKSDMACKAVLTDNGTLYLWFSARKGFKNNQTCVLYRFDSEATQPALLPLPENAPDLKYMDHWIVRDNLVYLLFKPRVAAEGKEYKLTGFIFANAAAPVRFDAVLSANDFTGAAPGSAIFPPRLLKAYINSRQQLIAVYDQINVKTEMSPSTPGQLGTDINTYTANGVCVIGFSPSGSELFRSSLTRKQVYIQNETALSSAVYFLDDEVYIAWGNYMGTTLQSIYTARINYTGVLQSSQTLAVPATHSTMYLNGTVCAWNSTAKRLGLIVESPARSAYSVMQVEY
ncbi:MAG: hypothetical protein IM638_19475 [Bacteroidetes bacterium]|nr:hypothetical protein [Bacteroidota bacterium]